MSGGSGPELKSGKRDRARPTSTTNRTAAEGQTQDAMPPITIGAEAGPKSTASVALPMGPLVLPPPILTRERQAFPQPDFAAQPASQPSEERPNSKKRIPCAFYLKTGNCAFGNECKFEHPLDQPATQYNSLGLPLRPGEPDCAYYVRNLHCGYGASCKFHHAEPVMGWIPMPMVDSMGMGVPPAVPGMMPYSQLTHPASPGGAGSVLRGMVPPTMMPTQMPAAMTGQMPAAMTAQLPVTQVLPYQVGVPIQQHMQSAAGQQMVPPAVQAPWGAMPHAVGPQMLVPGQMSTAMPAPLFAGYLPMRNSPPMVAVQPQPGFPTGTQVRMDLAVTGGLAREASGSFSNLRAHERSSRQRSKGRSGARVHVSGSDRPSSQAGTGTSGSRTGSEEIAAGEFAQLSLAQMQKSKQ